MTLLIKNEADSIQEWVEYYLLQGVDHFYIYNNNGTDNTYEILKPYIDQGLITWIECPGYGLQIPIYDHAVRRFKNETRWMGFMDCDEFVLPLKHTNIKEFLKGYEAYSQVLIYWCNYGSSGRRSRGEGLVIERFRKHQCGISMTPKPFVNPRAVALANVHRCFMFGRTVNERKEPVGTCELLADGIKEVPSGDIIRLNHYSIKSWEEFIAKRNRGDAMDGQLRISAKCTDEYFVKCDQNDEEDPPELMDGIAQQIRARINARHQDLPPL